MAPVVSWSNLPSELVAKIADHLPPRTDQFRLRSVCSAWRAALRHRHRHRLPNHRVIPNTNGFFSNRPANTNIPLITRTIFLLSPVNPNPNSIPWLIKTEEIYDGKFHIMHPFARYPIEYLPPSFPKVINLSDIKILELCQQNVLYFDSDNCPKAAYLPIGNHHDYVLLTINMSTDLAMFRSLDKQWKIIDYMGWSFYDVVAFDGMFYAVGYTRRTVVVSPDSGDVMVVVDEPMSIVGGLHLVPVGNELILVDMYHIVYTVDDEERVACSRVFKLDRDGSKWVEIDDLGDRVLFTGNNCIFSASGSDLNSKGNCICFSVNKEDLYCANVKYSKFASYSMKVYDMKTKRACYQHNFYNSKLFWPIPSWINSYVELWTATDMEKHQFSKF